jgi:hypothetical protein
MSFFKKKVLDTPPKVAKVKQIYEGGKLLKVTKINKCYVDGLLTLIVISGSINSSEWMHDLLLSIGVVYFASRKMIKAK